MVAASSLDAGIVDELERRLRESARFATVEHVAGGWIVAEAPLPGGPSSPAAARRAGVVFVEGAHRAMAHACHSVPRLLALLDRGPSALVELPGDVGLIRTARDGTALIARSCGGRVPLYVYDDGRTVAVSSLLSDLAEFLPGELRIDPVACAMWASLREIVSTDRSFVAGARLLPRGHATVARPGARPSFVRYWDPRPGCPTRPSTRHLAERAAELRDLLVDHLAEELDPGGGNLLSLSGGVDSSSIGALAVMSAQRPITTSVTVVPPKAHGLARELGYVLPLLDTIGVEQRIFLPGLLDTTCNRIAAAPRIIPSSHPVLGTLPRLHRSQPVSTYVGGEYADELFGRGAAGDWMEAVSLTTLLTRGRRMLGRRAILDGAVGRLSGRVVAPNFVATSVPEFVRRSVREESGALTRAWFRKLSRQPPPWRHLMARISGGVGWAEMNWEHVSPLGVRRVTPFSTRGVFELVLSCHPDETLADGFKTMLRRGLTDDVPHRNLHRRGKGSVRVPPPTIDPAVSWSSSAAEVVDDTWTVSPSGPQPLPVAVGLALVGQSCARFDVLRRLS